jgi:hypothetical protein
MALQQPRRARRVEAVHLSHRMPYMTEQVALVLTSNRRVEQPESTLPQDFQARLGTSWPMPNGEEAAMLHAPERRSIHGSCEGETGIGKACTSQGTQSASTTQDQDRVLSPTVQQSARRTGQSVMVRMLR